MVCYDRVWGIETKGKKLEKKCRHRATSSLVPSANMPRFYPPDKGSLEKVIWRMIRKDFHVRGIIIVLARGTAEAIQRDAQK